MEIGLLWYDDSKKKSLEEKVNEAVAAYCAKPRFAGQRPNTCYVHPSMVSEEPEIHLNGVRVVATTTVAPHHLFVGLEKTDGRKSGQSRKKRGRRKKSSRRRK
jgi:hypothetical protein